MVDLAEIQAVYYMVAATGVLVAAIYYVMNMRETTKTRRITFTNTMMQQLLTEEAFRREYDCYTMQWTDFEDFKRKYDSRVNPENYSKRMSLWSTYDSLGYLYRSGLIDLGAIGFVGRGFVSWDWLKFKPIIEEYRKTEMGPNGLSNFEYLAEAIMRDLESREPEVRARYNWVEETHKVAK